jgi:hypothetical protein
MVFMNERIKQLADEAAKFSAVMALPTGEPGDKLFVEKFAELLIRESLKVGEDYSEDFYHFKDEVLKHFGVEE